MDNRSTNPWDYFDFELEIRRDGQGEYSAHVLRSPEAGEPEESVRLPFRKGDLESKLEELEEALYTSSEVRSGRTRSTDASELARPSEQTLQDFGEELFRAIFTGEVHASYRMSLSNAKKQNKGLRLKLRVHPASGLTQLPWEFLYDPSFGQYLSLSARRPVVRYLSLPRPAEPLHVEPPLKILGMVANPSGLPPLDVEHEKRLVQEATERLRADGKVEVTWLEGETWRDLLHAVRHDRWHIFHFVGHGSFDPDKQEGALKLANEKGEPHTFAAKNLADILMDSDDLRLVFLNSCEGAKGSENDAFSSTAATLVNRGVAASVAMQYEITDDAAIEFSRSFYEAIADGLPVDAAVAAGRTSLSNEIGGTLEWGTPVLYMHSPDGRIFELGGDRGGVLGRYRNAVATAYAGERLHQRDADELKHLAGNTLRLAPNTAGDIEREVMGDTVDAVLERQSGGSGDSPWSRLWVWSRRNRLVAIGGALAAVGLVLAFLALNYLDPALENRAIKDLLVSHYEQVGVEHYEAAFADFSEYEQKRQGGLEGYIQSNMTWCHDVGADVREPQVNELQGDRANATVSVVYETTCGNSPKKFGTEIIYTWNLSKEDGEWKLDSRDGEDQVEYSHVPGQAENGASTESRFAGPAEGSLESITTSDTARKTVDDCGDEVTFEPAKTVDGRPDTSWEVAGTGIGEELLLKYDKPIRVNRIGIIPGHVKKDPCSGTDRFYQLYSVRKAEIEFSDESKVVKEFRREPEMQYIDGADHETTSLRIEILDTYPPGDKPGGSSFDYEDTGTFGKAAISEIKVEQS